MTDAITTIGVFLAVGLAIYLASVIRPAPRPPAGAIGTPAAAPLTCPTLFRRYMSSIIDGLLALTLLVAIGMLPGEGEGVGRTKFLAFFCLVFWYEPLFTSRWCTFGQWVTGIRVRRNDDPDEQLSLGPAVLRFAVKAVLGALSFFTMPFTYRYRAIHDLVARSVVIQVRTQRSPVAAA